MLLIYKPSNFITFNDLQDTCSITGQPFYLNYVGFQQTYSFPGHLAPQFWLVSTQLILSIVIRHLYFRWPPDNLLLSQSSSTQHHNNIKIYIIHWLLRKVWVSWKRYFPTGFTLYVSGFCHIHGKTPRGILPLNSSHQICLSRKTHVQVLHFWFWNNLLSYAPESVPSAIFPVK